MTRPTRCYPRELDSIPTPAVVVLIGASGSGKSDLAQCLVGRLGPHVVLSLDVCRAQIAGDPRDQDATPDAVVLLHKVLSHRCLAGLTTVVDAANVTAEDRAPLVNAASSVGLPAVAVVLDTPLEKCLAPPTQAAEPAADVVTDQHAAVISSIPTLSDEGFTGVYVISREERAN